MAFANGTTALYLPIAGSAGSSLWGTDVRKVLTSPDASGDTTTICNLGTGSTVTRTADPYSTSAADSDQTLFGWAVQPTDMNSLAGAKRMYPAGNHTLTIQLTISVAFTTETKNATLYVYRVGPAAARTRTLLGSATAAMPITSGSFSVAVALGEILFEDDGTIQYAVELTAGGLAVLGRTVTLNTGTSSGVAARVDTPALKTIADTVGSSTGTTTPLADGQKIINTVGSISGVGTVAGIVGSTFSASGSSSGVASATGAGSSVAGTVGTGSGIGSATGLVSIVLGTVGTVAIGSAGANIPTYSRGRVVNR